MSAMNRPIALSTLVIVGGLALYIGLVAYRAYAHKYAPCDDFQSLPEHDVPLRCLPCRR